MYTNGRWKFLLQNNPVLIRSMRRCNIWVKKGFFYHFPNSSVASRKEIAFPLLSWVHVVCSDMFHHIIERTCDIMHPTPSWWWHFAVTFPKLSMCFFFPSSRTFRPRMLAYCQYFLNNVAGQWNRRKVKLFRLMAPFYNFFKPKNFGLPLIFSEYSPMQNLAGHQCVSFFLLIASFHNFLTPGRYVQEYCLIANIFWILTETKRGRPMKSEESQTFPFDGTFP